MNPPTPATRPREALVHWFSGYYGEGKGEGKGEGEGEGEAKKHPNAFHGTLVWGMRKEHSNSR